MSTNRTEATKIFFDSRYPQPQVHRAQGYRAWFAGFVLLGVLVGLLGSLLVAWQYHTTTEPEAIGFHFLALNAGFVIAVAVAQKYLFKVSIRSVALSSCAIGFAGFLGLSFLVPPVVPAWRILGLAVVGFSGGSLTIALLHALAGYYLAAPGRAANVSGMLFGSGNLLATLIVGISYSAKSLQVETVLLSVVPLTFFLVYAANKFPRALEPVFNLADEKAARESLRDLRTVAALLFALLLFFQFGNEWAIAGWLPLFLIHRLGSNPQWAIFALAAYFLALVAGRVIGSWLLKRVNHRRLLLASVVVAVAGYLLLSLTGSMVGAWVAAVVIGLGFGPVYPLVAEQLDERFSYHPGFYSSIFSIAITGAMSAPWLLGYVDAHLGMQYVMLVPAFGSIAVLVLVLLIMLESHVMGGGKPVAKDKALAVTVGKTDWSGHDSF